MDLIVLAADKNMQQALQALQALLTRTEALGTRKFRFEVFAHPQHDPAVRTQAAQFLRPLQEKYEHALVVFDHEGSGAESTTAEKLESEVEQNLDRSGWGARNCVIVLSPELEAWVWSSSPNVDQVLGWQSRIPSLRQWLVEQGFTHSPSEKPGRPKEAMEAAMKFSGKRWSSAVFRQLASRVSFAECRDRSFLKLNDRLKSWFPVP